MQPVGEGAAAGDRLEAADVPAAAHHVVVVADVDVPDVAGRAVGAAVHVPAGDDARADAGADLHEQQERLVAPVHPVLADRHDVHVVVDQRRHAEVLRQPLAHRVVVPARHDRRVHGPAGDVLDRPGQADADAAERAEVAAGLAQQLLDRRLEPGEQRVGAFGDRDVVRLLGEDLAAQVGDRDAGVGGADVGADHDAGLAVEGERGRRSAAGRRAVGPGHQPLVGEQHVDALGDGRAGQPGGGGEVAAGDGVAVPHQVEDRAGRAAGRRRRIAALDVQGHAGQ